MKWHKVEDYPFGSDEYVLVSRQYKGQKDAYNCFVAYLIVTKSNKYWINRKHEIIDGALPTDRWCHIDLPED